VLIETRKVVKEYVFTVDDLEHCVKGRICKNIESDVYSWDISHYYRPSKNAATVYFPSKKSAPSLEETEFLLMAYARGFTNLDVKKNENY